MSNPFYAMFLGLRNFIMLSQCITVSSKVKLFGMIIPSLGLWFKYDVLCESSSTKMNYERLYKLICILSMFWERGFTH